MNQASPSKSPVANLSTLPLAAEVTTCTSHTVVSMLVGSGPLRLPKLDCTHSLAHLPLIPQPLEPGSRLPALPVFRELKKWELRKHGKSDAFKKIPKHNESSNVM